MPRMDGLRVARQLREQSETQDSLIVAITGFGREEDRERTKEAGFDLHLVKPAENSAVRPAVNEGKRPLWPVF
jgi:CheY-like chemotaxis protein